MDLHVLIVIACVFLASLFSLLFINKFFHGKTFEEVAAEKRLLAEKLYGPSKSKQRQQRKLSNKKDIKRDKQKQKLKDVANIAISVTKEADFESQNDSDLQSETQSESSPSHHNKKAHVEFVEPEVIEDINLSSIQQQNRSAANVTDKKKEKQRKVSNSKSSGTTGILVNKSEAIVVNKEILTAEPLNYFDVKPPKDAYEMKKQAKELSSSQQLLLKDDSNEAKPQSGVNENKTSKDGKAKETKKFVKASKKDEKEKIEFVNAQHQQQQAQEPIAIKDIKQHEEKMSRNIESPKNQNKKQQQQQKKKMENSVIDQLTGSDIIGVNALMSLFNQAELNRSEIQILIDYLLNKQQDAPVNHSEWSDDIVQKLKKQLNEKEKALQEEQEASVGIQAKLRDLRTEINTERLHFNATTKMYMEKLQSKDTEIMNLNQEIQNLNEKFNLERQQFQAKLRHEKQANSQELLGQIQQLNDHNKRLQSEIVQLQLIANASHQTAEDAKQKMNEIVQQQTSQILSLEKNLNDAKEQIARQQYDLELAKIVENEKESNKVEIRNLQNALDSTKSELNLAQNEIKENQTTLDLLNEQIENFKMQIDVINDKYLEQTNSYDKVKITLNDIQNVCNEKDKKISEYEIAIKNLTHKEDELMKQINEQKEKNNELRTKNWKLVEALQKAETATSANCSTGTVVNRTYNNLVTQTDTTKDENRIRELFQRLYPDAVHLASNSALTLSFDQWIEQVVTTHIKQLIDNHKLSNIDNNINRDSNNITTQTSITISDKDELHTQQMMQNKYINDSNNHTISSSLTSTTAACSNHFEGTPTNSNRDNKNSDNSDIKNSSNHHQQQHENETKQILLENVQLRAKVEQLTSIVTKTENLLTNLETQARDQEAHWRNVVQSKEEEIHLLKYLIKNPNGQDI